MKVGADGAGRPADPLRYGDTALQA